MDGLGARIKWAADRIGGLDQLTVSLPYISRRTLSDWANDKTEPKPSVLADIARVTSVSAAWLFTGEGGAFIQPSVDIDRLAFPKSLPTNTNTRPPKFSDDIERLERAIAVIEQALDDVGRVASPAVKAGMISAAYEMLEEPSDAVTGRILRLVKG